ncbi:ribonuclease H protein, partial [Trifolium medium]|nr:ribonuclease H protein [Trifolium medium]
MIRTREYLIADKSIKVDVVRTREVTHIGWKPPPSDWIKLNTDGSCSNDGKIGCGGILRGSEGEWLGGFAKFIGKGNAYIAKLWGVLEVLLLARRLNFKAVELHVDSLVVIKTISEDGRGSRIRSVLVKKIRQLIQLDWEVVVHHAYRESNKCADALANIGCAMGVG